jgi:hypothetical protein
MRRGITMSTVSIGILEEELISTTCTRFVSEIETFTNLAMTPITPSNIVDEFENRCQHYSVSTV